MKKFRSRRKMIRLFIQLVYEMIRNRSLLNENPENNFMIIQKICRKIVQSANIDLKVHGIENIPEEKKILIVSNHRCFFDVVFLILSMNRPISFVAAKELWHYPLLPGYLDALSCIALDRYATELTKLKESIETMKEAILSRNVVLFPEGECSYLNAEMKPFKKGGFMGISKLDVTIVPTFLKINNIHNIGRWMIPEGEVAVHFGEMFTPIDVNPAGAKANEIAEYAQEQIKKMADFS